MINRFSRRIHLDVHWMEIHTKRLTLRDYIETDLEDIHEYGSDPEVVRYMPFGPNTREDSQNFLNGVIAKQNEEPRTDYALAVVLRSEDKLIGGCRVSKVSETEAHLGYILNRCYWGNGYATEAAKAMVGFAFSELGAHRVYADCHPENAASIKVLEKVGMVPEGRRRDYMVFHGEYSDTLLYSILEHEWEKTR
jgi:RimJ/RimL family protein N-acetyltransferase